MAINFSQQYNICSPEYFKEFVVMANCITEFYLKFSTFYQKLKKWNVYIVTFDDISQHEFLLGFIGQEKYNDSYSSFAEKKERKY